MHGNGEIVHRLDGVEVMRYRHPQLDVNDGDGARVAEARGAVQLDGGSISIQSESFPIQFRRVAILNLKGCMNSDAENYKSYYVKPDLESCQYD